MTCRGLDLDKMVWWCRASVEIQISFYKQRFRAGILSSRLRKIYADDMNICSSNPAPEIVLEDVRSIHGKSPKEKSYWGRVRPAKETGRNRAMLETLATNLNELLR